jgi:ATP-dependent DNA helicase DinG
VDYSASTRDRSSRRKNQLLVLRQGESSREKLLDAFKKADKAVLFAASTFWQGVDVPGRALEMVIITRLPFQMPEDPILEAKVRLCRERGGDPFNQIQVPYAVMQFRQGIGRLIRSKTDRGVVAILDSRVVTKRYGPEFLSAIPDCSVTDRIEGVKAFLTTGSVG